MGGSRVIWRLEDIIFCKGRVEQGEDQAQERSGSGDILYYILTPASGPITLQRFPGFEQLNRLQI